MRNTTEPYDDAALGDYCQDALNVYFRDPSLLAGAQQRPGSAEYGQNVGTWATARAAQAMALHTNQETQTTFLIAAGHVYRMDSTSWGNPLTDVTPAGISIPSSGNPIGIVDIGVSIVVSDGVNRPWVGTNLTSTPITGAYIDIDGASGAWTAGWPTVYQGSVVFPTLTVPNGSNVTAKVGIVWSEPNQPTVGYTQSGYADFFNIIEHNATQVYALWGTNIGLFYFRASSIGFISGPLFSFTTSATSDSRSSEVGAITAAGIQQFVNNIFFTDAAGRPWMMPITGTPQPIWKQMAGVMGSNTYNPVGSTEPANIQQFTCSGTIPDLDLYAVASWTPAPGSNRYPNIWFVFDGITGNFCGRWQWADGTGVCAMARVQDTSGLSTAGAVFAAVGGPRNGSGGGGADAGSHFKILGRPTFDWWRVDSPLGGGSGTAIPVSVTTSRMGYSEDHVFTCDTATIITVGANPDASSLGVAPISVSVITPYSSNPTTFATNVTPNGASLNYPDQVFRTQIGLDITASRFVQFIISATTNAGSVSSQWGFQRITVPVTVSLAGPEDY